MSARDHREDGEIDSCEDIKNVCKISNYNDLHEEPRDIKPDLSSINDGKNKESSKRKGRGRKKHRSSTQCSSSSSSDSGSGSSSCSSSSSGSHSSCSSRSSSSSSSSSSSHEKNRRKRKHSKVAKNKSKRRRRSYSSSSSSSSDSRKPVNLLNNKKPSSSSRSKLSTSVVQKKEVGVQVPHYLIKELQIETDNMSALGNAFKFQLNRIKGLLVGKVVSGYYAKSPINYKVFDVTEQAANKLPAYIKAGKSVAQHFFMKQGISLEHPNWPCLVQDGGGGHKNYYPIELMYLP